MYACITFTRQVKVAVKLKKPGRGGWAEARGKQVLSLISAPSATGNWGKMGSGF